MTDTDRKAYALYCLPDTRLHKRHKKRVRILHRTLELRVKLYTYEPLVIAEFNNLDQFRRNCVGTGSR